MGDTVQEALERLRGTAESRVAGAGDLAALEATERELLGRKQGTLTAILRSVGSLPTAQRKSAGAAANTVREAIERLIADRRASLERGRMSSLADAEWIDVTAPGPRPPEGHRHPVSRAVVEVATIFERVGFLRVRHPEVDSDYYAFEALNMPPDHPARDEWETFFVAAATGSGRASGSKPRNGASERIVLTPHTSNGQVREMEQGYLPIRMVNIAKCYRRQIDATHTPMFHQFEGLVVDRGITMAHLKGTFDYFVRSYFGQDRRTRLRPFHFRFTEPSVELDISCAVCGGTGSRDGAKCKTCKSGWLELGGGGMVHPNVLRAGGIDPRTYSGFAFGWGVERVAMMKYGIGDIRLLYGNDLRWLEAW